MKKYFTVALFLSLCLPTASWGQDFQFQKNRKKDAIDFKLVKNLIVIPLYINNKGPFNFILDTGVSPMLVTDPTILDSSDYKDIRNIKLTGLGKGNDVDAYASNSLVVRVGKSSMEHVPAAILKKDIFNLSNFLGIHVHGLIGYYFLNSFVVKIKYSSQKVRFYSPDSKIKIKGEPIDITLILNKPYLQASLDAPNVGRIEAKLLMDSGASNSLSLESYQGEKFPKPKKSIPANLGMGFSGLISGSIARVPEVNIGPFLLKDVIASYPNYEEGAAKALETGRNGTIGADLLRHFDITLDYQNGKIYLKPNSYFHSPFEHDMSGLEIYIQEGKSNRFYVERIEPNSPGTRAGIQPGDEIISLNFNSVRSMDLENIGNLLKSGDGKSILVEIYRKQESIFKVLTLKKRI